MNCNLVSQLDEDWKLDTDILVGTYNGSPLYLYIIEAKIKNNQGWVNITNLPIVCIPNDVRIVISSTLQNSSDIIIFGGYKYEEKSY